MNRHLAVRIGAAVAAVAAATALATGPATAVSRSAGHPGTGAAAGPVSARETAADKALVTYVYKQLFTYYDTSVIDKYISPDYVQHNPTVANGPEALRQLVENLKATATPGSGSVTTHVIAQGDLVLLQTNAGASATSKGIVLVDVFRVANHKIVEHWDTIQPVPATTANGHDMFSTLTSPQTDAAGPASHTAASERVVRAYVQQLTGRKDLGAVDRYVSPKLVQHDPALADGAAATKQAYADLFAAHPQYQATVAKVVAEGDLVAVHLHDQNSPSDLGTSVYEIFRVRGGKIVEHWAVTQAVPATSANGNSMF
ncbi:nuclear transport factor 2 family protein [Streptomyces hyaluromycini]|uniref:nuclear transport factor 2 family protein n=1 Tax=Streptomyces hyaluromycini TaxID=1377993 RepID=UPI000B5C4A53|nr:nuclear transport factor 2 family protein [Streptomyces hyaluromycini]